MEIAVYLKQVPNGAQELHYQDVGYMNQSDKNAVIHALNLRDDLGESKVTVISLGGQAACRPLKEAMSMGVDHVIWVSDEEKGGSIEDGGTKIARAIKQTGPYDLILCGRQALDGDGAHMAANVSEALGIPLVCYGREIQLENKKLQVTVGKEDGEYKLLVPLPAVVMSVKINHRPRYSKVSDIMRAYNTMSYPDTVPASTDEPSVKGPVMIRQFQPESAQEKKVVFGDTKTLMDRLENMNFITRQGGKV